MSTDATSGSSRTGGGDDRVRADVTVAEIAVAPGEAAEIEIEVTNVSEVIRAYRAQRGHRPGALPGRAPVPHDRGRAPCRLPRRTPPHRGRGHRAGRPRRLGRRHRRRPAHRAARGADVRRRAGLDDRHLIAESAGVQGCMQNAEVHRQACQRDLANTGFTQQGVEPYGCVPVVLEKSRKTNGRSLIWKPYNKNG